MATKDKKAPEAETLQPDLKETAAATDRVVNTMGGTGCITGIDGERVPSGGSVELPVAVCENLVALGKARYLNKAELGE